jgi:hypothetical protein
MPLGRTELIILCLTIIVGLLVFRQLNARDTRDGPPRRRTKRDGERKR